jgi:uncharacterized protein (DUF924 family)
MIDKMNDVVEYWFGTTEDGAHVEPQVFWFKSTPELDEEIRLKFLDLHDEALSGTFDGMVQTSNDYLAIIILFDQLPRNMFRNTSRAFATDENARIWTRKAIENGIDTSQSSVHRQSFFYLPLEHSEDLNDQNESVQLFKTLGYDNYTRYAVAHRDVIASFGRFTHRNKILGRESTPEEIEYLSKPGARF